MPCSGDRCTAANTPTCSARCGLATPSIGENCWCVTLPDRRTMLPVRASKWTWLTILPKDLAAAGIGSEGRRIGWNVEVQDMPRSKHRRQPGGKAVAVRAQAAIGWPALLANRGRIADERSPGAGQRD